MSDLLNAAAIATAHSKIPGWELADKEITRTFEFPAYLDGVSFVDKVAVLAEEADHHPDIDIRWRKVHLLLTTHSAGGLTELDFDLAEKIDAVYG